MTIAIQTPGADRNHGGPGSVQCAMTILDTLPPMRAHGALEISRTRSPTSGSTGRLLLQAPSAGRCPILLADHALGSLPRTGRQSRRRRSWNNATSPPSSQSATRTAASTTPTASRRSGRLFRGSRRRLRRGRCCGRGDRRDGGRGGRCPERPLLGLVPAGRPADVPAAAGWFGMCNSWDDVVAMSAVLRSWEDRFGAVLVLMGRATLELAVAAHHRGSVRSAWRSLPSTTRSATTRTRATPARCATTRTCCADPRGGASGGTDRPGGPGSVGAPR